MSKSSRRDEKRKNNKPEPFDPADIPLGLYQIRKPLVVTGGSLAFTKLEYQDNVVVLGVSNKWSVSLIATSGRTGSVGIYNKKLFDGYFGWVDVEGNAQLAQYLQQHRSEVRQ